MRKLLTVILLFIALSMEAQGLVPIFKNITWKALTKPSFIPFVGPVVVIEPRIIKVPETIDPVLNNEHSVLMPDVQLKKSANPPMPELPFVLRLDTQKQNEKKASNKPNRIGPMTYFNPRNNSAVEQASHLNDYNDLVLKNAIEVIVKLDQQHISYQVLNEAHNMIEELNNFIHSGRCTNIKITQRLLDELEEKAKNKMCPIQRIIIEDKNEKEEIEVIPRIERCEFVIDWFTYLFNIDNSKELSYGYAA